MPCPLVGLQQLLGRLAAQSDIGGSRNRECFRRLIHKRCVCDATNRSSGIIGGFAAGFGVHAAENAEPLWQIPKADHSATEFALAQNGDTHFLQRFGSPDRAFYVGLSDPASDWPCVLPGPLGAGAGSGHGGCLDLVNTLPNGCMLETVPIGGACALVGDRVRDSARQEVLPASGIAWRVPNAVICLWRGVTCHRFSWPRRYGWQRSGADSVRIGLRRRRSPVRCVRRPGWSRRRSKPEVWMSLWRRSRPATPPGLASSWATPRCSATRW